MRVCELGGGRDESSPALALLRSAVQRFANQFKMPASSDRFHSPFVQLQTAHRVQSPIVFATGEATFAAADLSLIFDQLWASRAALADHLRVRTDTLL